MSAAQVNVQQAPEPGRPAPPPPRVVVRADLVPAVIAFCLVAVLGLPLGWLWSRLAPPEMVGVAAGPAAGQVEVLPLVGQSEHRFDGTATFVLLGMAAGVLTGMALWLLRRRRGPVLLVGAVLGSLVAAWLALRVGPILAGWHYPPAVGGRPGQVFARAPVLESAWVVVVQPFGVAIAYSLAVAWNGTEDLDRGPARVSCGWSPRRTGSAAPAPHAAAAGTPPPGPAGRAPGAADQPGSAPRAGLDDPPG